MHSRSLKAAIKVALLVSFYSTISAANEFNETLPDCAGSCLKRIEKWPGCSIITDTCLCNNYGMLPVTDECVRDSCLNAPFSLEDNYCNLNITIGTVERFCYAANGIITNPPTCTQTTIPSPISTTPPPTTKSRPPYTGQPILTEEGCTAPYPTSTTISGTTISIAIAGCRKDHLECCPNVPSSTPPPNAPTGIFGSPPVSVKLCPQDYKKHGKYCCPTNATLGTLPGGSQTLCFSNVILPTRFPSVHLSAQEATATATTAAYVPTPTATHDINPENTTICTNCSVTIIIIGTAFVPLDTSDKMQGWKIAAVTTPITVVVSAVLTAYLTVIFKNKVKHGHCFWTSPFSRGGGTSDGIACPPPGEDLEAGQEQGDNGAANPENAGGNELATQPNDPFNGNQSDSPQISVGNLSP